MHKLDLEELVLSDEDDMIVELRVELLCCVARLDGIPARVEEPFERGHAERLVTNSIRCKLLGLDQLAEEERRAKERGSPGCRCDALLAIDAASPDGLSPTAQSYLLRCRAVIEQDDERRSQFTEELRSRLEAGTLPELDSITCRPALAPEAPSQPTVRPQPAAPPPAAAAASPLARWIAKRMGRR